MGSKAFDFLTVLPDPNLAVTYSRTPIMQFLTKIKLSCEQSFNSLV